MNKNIIKNETSEKYNINSYRMKILSGVSSLNNDYEEEKSNEILDPIQNKKNTETILPNEELDNNSFVEKLLERSDEMSKTLINLQMQLENSEKDFDQKLKTQLEKEKKLAFEEGYKKAKDEFDKTLEDLKTKYINSIDLIEKEISSYKENLVKIEDETSNLAVEIAQKVILKEVDKNSSAIASNLIKDLMSEITGYQKLEIHVNEKDFDKIKENLEHLENVNVIRDISVAQGGVVLISDKGNLDGNLSARLQRVKHIIEEK